MYFFPLAELKTLREQGALFLNLPFLSVFPFPSPLFLFLRNRFFFKYLNRISKIAMYFFPLAELKTLREQGALSAETLVRAYELYGEEMINLHLGQGLDI